MIVTATQKDFKAENSGFSSGRFDSFLSDSASGTRSVDADQDITLSDAEVFERVRKLKMKWSDEERGQRQRVGAARREELALLVNDSELSCVDG